MVSRTRGWRTACTPESEDFCEEIRGFRSVEPILPKSTKDIVGEQAEEEAEEKLVKRN